MTNSKTLNISSIFKQILNYSLLPAFVLFISCNTQNKPKNVTEQPAVPKDGTSVNIFGASNKTEIDKNIRSIFQDKNGNYWFGTNAAGVYRYDGKTLTQFTEKEGLSNNQVQSIQEDKSGNIWFGTGRYQVSRFDGQTFTTLTNKQHLKLSTGLDKDWKLEPDDLWFYAGGGVYHYNGNLLTYLPIPKYSKDPPNRLSRYGVYCILKDKKGNLWFGTQNKGVCRYDGKSFTWFTKKGLAGPAVLGLFEDKKGNLWFGNNGYGLFRYDGKSLTNFTQEKRLSNNEFKASGKSNPGTLARIYAINEDNNENLWIGTVDAGVWRYDGKTLTNYTTKDGLTSNAVNTIYKDKKGELWFGTDGAGVCKFNGKSFTKFTFQ
jgi:ligand-binding sensor domain-containing protein